jgi:hypothetical protein
MSTVEAYRTFVTARAGGACENCRLLQIGSGITFHIEHIRPRSLGGQTILSNLALSCPGCNMAKGQRIAGVDVEGVEQRLFNPRDYAPSNLGWHLHFAVDRQTGRIIPRSPTGEPTITTLNINDPQRSFARKLQIEAGLIS